MYNCLPIDNKIMFLANLTLTMVLAYNDGDIVTSIKTNVLMQKTNNGSIKPQDNNDNKLLLVMYITERYASMWRIYFVCHLKGNGGKRIQNLANSQTT
jgi:hypothetical protein